MAVQEGAELEEACEVHDPLATLHALEERVPVGDVARHDRHARALDDAGLGRLSYQAAQPVAPFL